MKIKLIASLLLAGSSLFAGSRFSFSVGIGGPAYYAPPPPAYYYERPRCPGPGYTWVEGYWYFSGNNHRLWSPGYWAAPRYNHWHDRHFRR